MKRILILCTGNSCRSQIAHGYFSALLAESKVAVYSAGIEAHGVNPKAVAVMKEVGIDISQHTSNLVADYKAIDFDFVITVCDNAKENCPIFYSKGLTFHQNFDDPAKAKGTEQLIMQEFRRVSAQIKNFCTQFVNEHLKDHIAKNSLL